MRSTNEFQYWTSKGFYWDTIYPLIEYSRTGSIMPFVSSHIFSAIIFLTILSNCIYVFFQLKKSNYKLSSLSQPIFIATSIIIITAIINIIQCKVLNVPNLHGRTSLFFYPLFVTVFVCFLGVIPQSRKNIIQTIIAASFSFIFIFHVANGFKVNWVREWYFDGDTYKVLDFMEKDRQGKTIKLKTWWFMHNSFYYYYITGKVPWVNLLPYGKPIDPDTEADYYYILSEDYQKLEPKFEVILKLNDNRWLLKRRPGK